MAVRNGSRGSAVGGSDLCGPPRPPCPPAWSRPAPVAGGWCSARRRGVPARSRRRSTSRSPDSRDRRCPRRGGLTPAAGRSTVGSMDGRSHPGTAALHEGLPPRMRDAVDAFAAHLSGERNRSVHTVRAYITDVVSLLDHAARMGGTGPSDVDLAVLRSWLARLRTAGAARSTLGRRGAAARTFCTWAHRQGLLAVDVGQRLASPRARRELPAVLRADQAAALVTGPPSGPGAADLRDRAVLELLYATGI